jgi:predicted component of type VI protein secretion system
MFEQAIKSIVSLELDRFPNSAPGKSVSCLPAEKSLLSRRNLKDLQNYLKQDCTLKHALKSV